mmetsp:Transcript_15290/g.37777  ORF Transcript_15290/g.37777 Transcript_15290/m.37777 type:complete len:103 (+) Transcript_15290:1653-1961(+)
MIELFTRLDFRESVSGFWESHSTSPSNVACGQNGRYQKVNGHMLPSMLGRVQRFGKNCKPHNQPHSVALIDLNQPSGFGFNRSFWNDKIKNTIVIYLGIDSI